MRRVSLLIRPAPKLDFALFRRQREWKLDDQIFNRQSQDKLFRTAPATGPFVCCAEEHPTAGGGTRWLKSDCTEGASANEIHHLGIVFEPCLELGFLLFLLFGVPAHLMA